MLATVLEDLCSGIFSRIFQSTERNKLFLPLYAFAILQEAISDPHYPDSISCLTELYGHNSLWLFCLILSPTLHGRHLIMYLHFFW